MNTYDGTEITSETAAHKFGGDRMAEYLYCLAGSSGQDEETGTVDMGIWVARFGRRLLGEDDQGFVTCQRFATEDEARREFASFERSYGEWLDANDED